MLRKLGTLNVKEFSPIRTPIYKAIKDRYIRYEKLYVQSSLCNSLTCMDLLWCVVLA